MIDLDAARELARSSTDMTEDHPQRRLLRSISEEYGGIWPSDDVPPETSSKPQTITAWQRAIHDYAKDKGWWDGDDRSFGDLCMLFVCELAEAYEEYRNHHEPDEIYFNDVKPTKPEGIPIELADCVIRILDYFGRIGVDLQSVMDQKHRYNLTRSYRHGNKRA